METKKTMMEKPKYKQKRFRCCYGISSKASEDGKHALFLDYDRVPYEIVIEHIHYMQTEYLLGDFYLIESRVNGGESMMSFNAICLNVLPLGVCRQIGNDVFSPCDRDFVKYGYMRGYYTLRFDCDKVFLGVIRSDNNKYEKSLVHKKWLEWFFDIEIPSDKSFNDYDKVCIVQYPSTKNGYHLVDKTLPSYYGVLK